MTSSERLLLAVPRRPSISEAWLDRHAQSLLPLLVGLTTYEDPPVPWLPEAIHVGLGHKLAFGRYGLGRLTGFTDAKAKAALAQLDPTGTVVHYANFLDLLGAPGQLLPDVPTLVYVHGFDITWSPLRWCPVPYKNYGNTKQYIERLKGYATNAKVTFMANSEHSKHHLIEAGLPSDSVSVCYLPVDIPNNRAPRSLVDNNELQLLYVGRFVDFKGPLEAIRAAAKAHSRGVKLRFTMIGEGALTHAAETLVKELGATDFIHLKGSLPNDQVHAHLDQADALLLHNKVARHTGQVEAFGYAHIEALAHGVPVLTGKSGGPVEFLEHRGNGLLVEPEDVDGQADQIEEFAGDATLRRALSDSARDTAKRLFSPIAHVDRIEQLLQSLRTPA